jgi:hypothetical protein
MAKRVPFFWWVADARASYWWCRRHATLKRAQWEDGTHRLEEPVSKMTAKGCGGVPRPMGP